jgi:hypothetical protein
MKSKKIDWLELVIVILPILFIAIISFWHAFGIKGVQPWSAVYFLSNHLFIIYLAAIIYFTTGSVELQNIMKYLVIPYFSVKIVYQLLIWIDVNIGSGELWEWIWGIIFVIVLLIGAIMLWSKLRKIG